ncbi:MAG: DMT family transporter [Paracoccus sp. (in: a-proteobacteria)]
MPTSAEILARRLRPRGDDPDAADRLAGIAIFVSAVVLFAVVDTSAKWLILTGIPALTVVFVRYLGHLVLILALTLPRDGLKAFRSVNPRLQFYRSLCLLGSSLFNFLALSYLPLAVAISIMFAGPIFVTLLSMQVLGEPVTRARLAAVALGFLGVLVVVQPWGAAFNPAMLISIAAMLCASMYFILTRRLADESTVTHQIWSGGVATVVLLPILFLHWEWPQGALEWAVFVLIGPVALMAHTLVVQAHQRARASVLAPVVYLQLIFVSISGYLVFGDIPGLSVIMGGGIIVAAGLWLRQIERAARGG